MIAEVLGEPADEMRNPANAGYQCPFINDICVKTGRNLPGNYLPVCTLYRSSGTQQGPAPITVCPKRFFERQIHVDVIKHAWIGPPPTNPQVAYEVAMEKFGQVDMVVADIDPTTYQVQRFVSVEIQAVDITGSYVPAYEALIHNRMLDRRPTQNFNWANVRKRFISQLIAKGYYHHHWGTRVVAAIQTELFSRFQSHAHAAEVALRDSNIVFLLYDYSMDEEGRLHLELDRVVPTTHTNVMNAIMYEVPPDRQAFEQRILRKLGMA